MIFSVNEAEESLVYLDNREFVELDILERRDFQEWAIDEPRILGEELLIIASEYSNFEQTRNRLDILALDKAGKLVVAELKRDQADKTTDLQAIKYASYCATLSATDIQKDYREFWSNRNGEEITPEEVGETFVNFLEDSTEEILVTDDGWADFELDDRPRILLVAGNFGIEITAPVLWLLEEYELDISCVRVQAHEHNGQVLLNSQQVIPVTEAEEYMTRRREKQEQQKSGGRRRAAIYVLLERGVLTPGDEVEFVDERKPPKSEWQIEPDEEFWKATVTGDTGRADNVRWHYNDEVYSFTGLAKTLLHELVDRDTSKALNGYKYWYHPQYDYRTLNDLRSSGIEGNQ